jgi:signal transduction histidine kinase
VGVFTADHERLAEGVATWAAVALENARLYKAVREASQLKDEFLATLSHELRTPLNAILGYARMLRSGQIDVTKQARAIEIIERNATSLAQIVEDVLDVSRITAGKVVLNLQPTDPAEIIRNSILSVAPAAEARGVQIDTFVHPDVGQILADADRLQQVLWNLLSNAVKFTGRGGRVHVQLQRSEGVVEIVVSDTGIGIPAEFLPFLFDRFRQADSKTTREQGGLGLGLAIARNFIEMHGGTISASSPGEGEGSTFRVILPVMMPIEPAKDSERPL